MRIRNGVERERQGEAAGRVRLRPFFRNKKEIGLPLMNTHLYFILQVNL